MTNESNSFVLYANYFEILNELSNEDAGVIFKAILEYKATGNYNIPSHLSIAFKFIKNQLDLDSVKYQEKCEKAKANGLKGGRPKNQKNQTVLEKPNGFFENHNENVNDNENVNVNENVNENAPSEQKTKKEVFLNSSNPDLMFDKRINEVFSLYKKLCPNLCPIVFEERNLERRQEIKDLLILCRNDLNYIQGLFMRANEQITFYDNKINLKSLIKNHEAIYQGLGKKENPQKETAESMKDKFKEWEQRAKEREKVNG